jgi:hypothetical protein
MAYEYRDLEGDRVFRITRGPDGELVTVDIWAPTPVLQWIPYHGTSTDIANIICHADEIGAQDLPAGARPNLRG